MKKLADVQVDEEVYLVTNHSRDPSRRIKVTKVGRKYITIEEYGRPSAFDKETGRVNDDYGHRFIYTIEQYDYRNKVATATTELRKYGIDLNQNFKGDAIEVYERLLPTFDKTV